MITAADRAEHHRWLLELTSIPTAAGHEQRVAAWVRRWAAERPEIIMGEDAAGNLHLATASGEGPPIYFTAHLDHPAFTVERVVGPGTLVVAFRGGVMEDYFAQAKIVVHDRDAGRHPATLADKTPDSAPFPTYLAELESDAGDALRPGDIATWDLPASEITDGLLHAPACDDLAAVAAALAAYDTLLRAWRAEPDRPRRDVRLLFTRAEEVGFLGAIAACRERTMPLDARVVALENSRSFDDSPIGGGPIVRVGDRMSIFSPGLTAAIAKVAEDLSGGPATPMASQKQADRPWKWQRKLMAGGACEATVFCAYGYDATCLCLPLGNYHNMADLAAVQAGKNTTPPRIDREFISVADFDGLVDLLAACGRGLPAVDSVRERIDRLWNERAFVLER